MNHQSYPDTYLRDILEGVRTIAVVGASPRRERPSHGVMAYLQRRGYRTIPVNPNAVGGIINGERCYASLAEVSDPIDMVDVFRRPEAAGGVVDEAIAVGCADGARLAADEAAQTVSTLLTYAPELGTSMYFDRLAGRALEVEALTGAIVTAGERHGIATPLNRALLALLRAINDVAVRNASG